MENVINGTIGADSLPGTNGTDLIKGFKGNDTLLGRGGNDTLEGGNGKDTLEGGGGNDVAKGGAANDRLMGRAGNDTLEGGDGKDTLDGGSGNDRVRGGNGSDNVIISDGVDTLDGGAGNDWLDASKWTDGVYWNAASFGRTDFTTGVQISANMLKLGSTGESANWLEQSVSGFENFRGSAARDFVTGLATFDKAFLGGGDDSFSASSVTLVRGGGGADRIAITSGRAEGGRGNDVLSGGRNLPTEMAVLHGNRGNDLLIVGGPSEARGGNGNDTIQVLDANSNSMFFGGAGADVFEFNSTGSGAGAMQDFTPDVDKIDIKSYTLRQEDTWADLQDMFEQRPEGVALVLDLQNFKNQTFTFIGLTRADLSEGDFILA